jgi:hypothetical protein
MRRTKSGEVAVSPKRVVFRYLRTTGKVNQLKLGGEDTLWREPRDDSSPLMTREIRERDDLVRLGCDLLPAELLSLG